VNEGSSAYFKATCPTDKGKGLVLGAAGRANLIRVIGDECGTLTFRLNPQPDLLSDAKNYLFEFPRLRTHKFNLSLTDGTICPDGPIWSVYDFTSKKCLYIDKTGKDFECSYQWQIDPTQILEKFSATKHFTWDKDSEVSIGNVFEEGIDDVFDLIEGSCLPKDGIRDKEGWQCVERAKVIIVYVCKKLAKAGMDQITVILVMLFMATFERFGIASAGPKSIVP
jgi:hypothetical protein